MPKTFIFSNTPHDGIPFDVGSAKEINDHLMRKRPMFCLGCSDTVQVNILDVFSKQAIEPIHSSTLIEHEVRVWNRTFFSDDPFVVWCPSCGIINPTSQVEGEYP